MEHDNNTINRAYFLRRQEQLRTLFTHLSSIVLRQTSAVNRTYVSLGCGTAADIALLSSDFSSLIGVDHNSDIIDFCRQYAVGSRYSSTINHQPSTVKQLSSTVNRPPSTDIRFVHAVHLIWLEQQADNSIDVLSALDVDSNMFPEEIVRLAAKKLKQNSVLIMTEREDNERIYGRYFLLPFIEEWKECYAQGFTIETTINIHQSTKQEERDNVVIVLRRK